VLHLALDGGAVDIAYASVPEDPGSNSRRGFKVFRENRLNKHHFIVLKMRHKGSGPFKNTGCYMKVLVLISKKVDTF
jgi:hypothetical protein